ncbi:outer membrane beta-barrel family protein [Ferruginibacter sp. HRS2-29]|uniref:outer membrane beta-barrel family protein n=1 Tax=Ferruginibacter sp. HRS2-29 TaxID=2487334 RepID=UPI0020CD0DA9|nr:outer membrane beta-barrel family protein [Ferruginibacter sp. HRS2-29]MCP9753355.1 TonB-dependent receptor [Ferruginibacter sp. HRS2-29]
MFRTSALYFLLMINVGIVSGQKMYTGSVVDDHQKPVAFVSVALLYDDRFLSGTTCDETGVFRISYDFEDKQRYTIRLSQTGMTDVSHEFVYPDTMPNVFIMHPDRNLLNDVTVTAKRPLITRRSDRYIINIENSLLATGNSGLEVLQKSPGIWVNSDGAIRMKGNQAVTVMINDVVQRMTSDELVEYLKTLRSEDISKIEVIQNPPSEFEASGSGGIVHIILKKARKNGLNGSVNSFNRLQGKTAFINGGLSLDYKINRFYISGGSSISRDRNVSTGFTNVSYPDEGIYNTNGKRYNDNRRQHFRVGMGYDFNQQQSISIQSAGFANQFLNKFYTASYYKDLNEETNGNAYTDWIRKPLFISTTLNYTWKTDTAGSLFKFIADHTYGKKTETNLFIADYSDPSQNATYLVSTPTGTGIFSLQGDYTKVLSSKIQVKMGMKFASSEKDNELIREDKIDDTWEKDTALSNHFIYRENIWMYYASMERIWGNTSLKAGIRAEHTISKGNSITSEEKFKRSYLGLFPSVFITRSLNEAKGNSLYLNYSRRLQRPGFRELNPYRLQFDNHTIMLGNPYLTPQYTHSIETGVNFLRDYSASVYLAVTEKVIGQLATTLPGNNIEYKFQNLDKNTEYGLMLSSSFNILKGWNSTNDASVFHSAYTIGQNLVRQNNFSARSIHSISLRKIMDVEIAAEYRSGAVVANTKYAGQFYCDIGLSRKVWKGKGRVRLYCSDITNSSRDNDVTDYTGTHIYFYQKRQTRNPSISFSYNFSSGKKFNAKKIESGNTDNRN